MKYHLVAAVFDTYREADAAVQKLHAAGVEDNALSVLARNDVLASGIGGVPAHERLAGSDDKVPPGADGIGSIIGTAALAVPGVGPSIAAGAIASSTIPAAMGAHASALIGGMVRLIQDHGASAEDARFYEQAIRGGGIFVSVDTSLISIGTAQARDILAEAGGKSPSVNGNPRTLSIRTPEYS